MRADVDAEAVAVTVIGALGGIAYQYLLDPRGIDLDAVYPELADSLERGLRA